MEADGHSSSTPRQNSKKSFGFPSLFRRENRERESPGRKQQQQQQGSQSLATSATSSYTRSHTSSSQATSTRSNAEDRCLPLLCGSPRGKGRRNTDNFTYDPLSYSLNFDEGSHQFDQSDDLQARSFSARLPATPLPASHWPVFSERDSSGR